MIFQPKQRVELALLPFFNPLGDVVLENEVKERPLLDVESGIDEYPRMVGTNRARDRRECVGKVGENVEKVALLSADKLLHDHQLIEPEVLCGQALQ